MFLVPAMDQLVDQGPEDEIERHEFGLVVEGPELKPNLDRLVFPSFAVDNAANNIETPLPDVSSRICINLGELLDLQAVTLHD